MKHATLLRRGLFSIATAAMLGFGATQAMAAPAADKPAKFACDAAADSRCVTYCQSKHYDTGWCDPLYVGGCHCLNY